MSQTTFLQQDKFVQEWASYEPDVYFGFLLALLNPKDGELMLDNGCGNGRFSVPVGKNGSNVVALDMSKLLLRKAQSKIKEEMLSHRVDLVLADMQNLPFRVDTFDKILCVHNLWYVPSYQKAVEEMLKALKKNGEILVDHLNLLHPRVFRAWVIHFAMKILRRSPPPVFYRIPNKILSPFSDSQIEAFSLVIKPKSRLYVMKGVNPFCLRLIIKCSKQTACSVSHNELKEGQHLKNAQRASQIRLWRLPQIMIVGYKVKSRMASQRLFSQLHTCQFVLGKRRAMALL